MQLLSCFANLILLFILSIMNGSDGQRILETKHVIGGTSNQNEVVHPSTNDTTFSSEVHLTFSNRRESTILTPQEEAFLDSTMMLAFEHSKFSTSDFYDQDVMLINAQIVNTTNEKHFGTETRRNMRYRPRRNRFYRIYDYSILLDFGCGHLCGDKSGFWDRRLAKLAGSRPTNEFVTEFGRHVCNVLRASTYKVFTTVTDCRIRFA